MLRMAPRSPAAPAQNGKPAAPASTSWGVFHQLHVPGRRGAVRRLRLVLEGVPVDVKKPAVLAALEAAGCAAAFSDAGVAWANHVVLSEARWPAELDTAPDVQRWTWEALNGAQKARTVTLRLEPADYAAIALAAASAGEDLYPWCRAQLLEAAGR